jgi:hypothetical protein
VTERVLARLGSPRAVWIALWAAIGAFAPVVLLSAVVLTGAGDRVGSVWDVVTPQIAVAYAVVLSVWGAGRLTTGASALEPQLAMLAPPGRLVHVVPEKLTLGAPIALALSLSIVSTAGLWVRYGPVPAVAVAPLVFASVVPIMTFVWTYLQLLLGLDRLGRVPLALDSFPEDRSLGLRDIGSLAFSGFLLLFGVALPIVATSAANVSTVAVSLAVVGGTVAMFFLSMSRLHRQMADAKERHIATVRRLYADAYAPVAASATPETLAMQATMLTAAQGLSERADRILEWPVDEGTTALVAIIATGVVTSVVVRLIFAAAHL